MHFLFFINFIVATLIFWSCETKRSGAQRDDKRFVDGVPGSQLSDFPMEASLNIFQDTVYKVVRESCVGQLCHSNDVQPLFSTANASQAHEALINGSYVDFFDIERSTIYERVVSLGHNCGDCEATGEGMYNALVTWKSKLEGSGYTPKAPEFDLRTPETKFTSGELVSITSERDDVIVLKAENCADPNSTVCSLTAPMVYDAASDSVQVPEATGNSQTPEVGGRASFSFSLPAAGNFRVYGVHNSPSGTSNSAYVSLNQGAFSDWRTEVNGDSYDLSEVRQQGVLRMNIQFPLVAGMNQLRLNQREDGTSFQAIMIAPIDVTEDELLAIQRGPSERINLSFDLSQVVQANAKLLVYYYLVDEKTKAMSLSNLRIETDKPLKIKSPRPLLNGKLRLEYSTFVDVDRDVPVGLTTLSSSDLRLIGEKGAAADNISFIFEELSVIQ